MTDVTRILCAIENGNLHAANELLPLVYEELRKLASRKMAQEKSGHTFQTTSLVHEAYVRLVDTPEAQRWNSRGHFFAAAAEAMRRILIENARRKKTEKHGGRRKRVAISLADPITQADPDAVLDIDQVLADLAMEDAKAAEVAKLKIFAGLSIDDTAKALSIPRATAYRQWAYARAWLQAKLQKEPRLT